jgi:hypothetical protein
MIGTIRTSFSGPEKSNLVGLGMIDKEHDEENVEITLQAPRVSGIICPGDLVKGWIKLRCLPERMESLKSISVRSRGTMEV